MSKKSTIHAALDKLTAAAIGFAPAEDGLALLVLRNAVADAVRELPDAQTMANLRDVGAPHVNSDDMTCRESAAEHDLLLAECKKARADSAKLTEQIAMFRAFESTVKCAISALTLTDTPTLILAELRKHTALLETLGKQGDTALIRAAARWDASSIRVAPDSPAGSSPFDPVFECEEKDGKLIATISLRPGACAYLVNASGPRSPAIKFSADGPKHVQVAPLVEILP